MTGVITIEDETNKAGNLEENDMRKVMLLSLLALIVMISLLGCEHTERCVKMDLKDMGHHVEHSVE